MPNKKTKPVINASEHKDAIISEALQNLSNNEQVVRVFLEEKSVTAYKKPLVEKPDARLSGIKTYGKENYPNQASTKLPDPFADLPDDSRAYLKMWPYGDNVVINRKQISKLYEFYLGVKDLPLPRATQVAFREHLELLREMLNLCTLDALTEDELRKGYEPSYPSYICECPDKKPKRTRKTK